MVVAMTTRLAGLSSFAALGSDKNTANNLGYSMLQEY